MRARVTVSFELPPGATREDAALYVHDAVRTMKGSYRPDNWDGEGGEGDAMFYMDSSTVETTCPITRHNKRSLIRFSGDEE